MRQVVVQGEEPTFVYVPFHTSDLFNWKNQNPSFREDPEKMQSLFRSIEQTHRPTWADVQMMLHTLLTSEERRLVLGVADRIAEGQAGPGRDIRDICPIESPDWDNNLPEGRDRNGRYLGIIVEALGKAVLRVTNLSKLYDVHQRKDESPSSFLERLYDAFKEFSSLDPEAQENQRMVNMLFIGQAAPDIRKKLQKTEGGPGKPLSELVEIAYKVYGNRDQVAERKEEKHGQKQMAMLAAALSKNPSSGRGRKEAPEGGKKRGKGRLQPDECAYCREKGHWKKDCPRKDKKKETQPLIRQMWVESSGEDSS
ncbi:hypothetical protein Y1Q_0019880 [Alligator mississippiensis]|uniref:CCHC-type domain-containing protein n=1 Tax=Alligator mississippiensis TaxID=8496 RepID=A0A151PFQ6_ALLMI|nr:hypothetical protein Y1Q_0019880 [Alligator mississippiensis]